MHIQTRSVCVYVSGPYSKGDKGSNVLNATRAGVILMDNGITPYIPHLSHFIESFYPRPYEEWLHHDRVWIERCDALLRLSGDSVGADWEKAVAFDLGKPVFFLIERLVEYFKTQKETHLWPTMMK